MELTDIEKFTQTLLKEQLRTDGETMFADYLHERDYVISQLLEEIKSAFPDGTDHGPRHIANVLNNAARLLGIESHQLPSDGPASTQLCALHLLCLISCILYHDVGNVIDRKAHQHRVEHIYNTVWGSKSKLRMQNRDLIRIITRSHCGQALDGTRDTLKEVGNKIPFRGKPIRAQELAAILRLADELAEGPQRTSVYKTEIRGYSEESQVYHDYAASTHVTIDRASRRIALTYYIDLEQGENGQIKEEERLKKLIEFIFIRIEKLDEERQYTRHYTDLLDVFKETSVAMNFSVNGSITSIGLSELVLTDLKIPGSIRPRISELDGTFDVDHIITALKEAQLASKNL